MENKFTKGEWYVHTDQISNTSYIKTKEKVLGHIYQEDESEDEEYNSGSPTSEEAEANAKLIAAAPELLEALIKAREHIWASGEIDRRTLSEIDEAIKKATE